MQCPGMHSFLQERQSFDASQVCGNNSWLIPLGLSLPYLWRFCQCIRVNKDTGNTAQLYNALKYSTAFPVVLFSYMNYHTDEQTWATFYRPLWVLSALLNSAYSYYWDVERDWDVQWFSAPAGGAVASLSFVSFSLSFSVCKGRQSSELWVYTNQKRLPDAACAAARNCVDTDYPDFHACSSALIRCTRRKPR